MIHPTRSGESSSSRHVKKWLERLAFFLVGFVLALNQLATTAPHTTQLPAAPIPKHQSSPTIEAAVSLI